MESHRGAAPMLATFAADGPERCSGLPVARYDATDLERLLDGFTVLETSREVHVTPGGAVQPSPGSPRSWTIEGGHIVDGHGDLLTDDIYCRDDGPRILDCLEFDARLRHCDVLSDIAMLAMDLERLGRLDLSELVLSDYREFSGSPIR
jgi:hypothetical protein